MKLDIAFGTENLLFKAVQEIRSDVSDQVTFDFDDHSYHYLMRDGERLIGALSAQRATDGTLDCEPFYPETLRSEYAEKVYSTCKFRMRPSDTRPLSVLRMLVRDGWVHQLTLGARLTVINATDDMVRFYERIGFSIVPNCRFIHPVLMTNSVVMIMAADPSRRSFCQDLFQSISDPLSQDEVVRHCSRAMPLQEAC